MGEYDQRRHLKRDYVVLSAEPKQRRTGDIVIALIDEEATVKRFL